MKSFICSLLSLIVSLPLLAQDVSEGNYEYMKKETAPGYSIVVQGDPKNVEKVVEQLIEDQSKGKARSKKGMMVFEDVKFDPISSEKVTLYFTMEYPSRKDKEHTRVNLFIRDNIGQFVTSVTGPRTAENAISWLEDLEVNVKIYEMQIVLEDQQKVLEKAMKEQNSLVDDSVSLQKDLIDLQQSIEDKHEDIEAQKQAVADENKRLSDFRAKLEALREERETQRELRRRSRRN